MRNIPLYAMDRYGDRVRDGIVPVGGASNEYEIGASYDLTFGWLGPALSRMAKLRTFALSLNEYNPLIMIDQNGPTQTMYSSMEAMLNACRIACQGVATKGANQKQYDSGGVLDNEVATIPAATRCFGVRVSITNPPQSFPFGRMYLQLRDGTTALYTIAVEANVLPCQLILLGVNSAGGPASIVGLSSPRIAGFNVNPTTAQYASAVIPGTTWLNVETLNMRDIGVPQYVAAQP